MDEAQLKDYTEKAFKSLLKGTDGQNSRQNAQDVFDRIQQDNTLTPTERQRVFCGLSKAVTEHECNAVLKEGDPTTLMRADSNTAMFVNVYMEHYAKDYFDAVTAKALQTGKGNPPNELNTSTDILQAYTSELPQLSGKAAQFLKVSVDTIKEKLPELSDEATSNAMSNALLLRGASPKISVTAQTELATANQRLANAAASLRTSLDEIAKNQKAHNMVEGRDQAELDLMNLPHQTNAQLQRQIITQQEDLVRQYTTISNANRSVQEYANKMGEGLNRQGAKDLAKDQETVGEFSTTLNEIAEGQIDQFKNIKAPKVNVDKSVQEVQTEVALDKRLNKLESRKDRLESSPSVGDKLKAFLKHGRKGTDAEVSKLEQKIEATELARDDVQQGITKKDRVKVLDSLKKDAAKHQERMDGERSIVFTNNVEKSLNLPRTHTKTQVDKAIRKYKDLEPEQMEKQSAIRTQEKSLKVRGTYEPKPNSQGRGNQNHPKL